MGQIGTQLRGLALGSLASAVVLTGSGYPGEAWAQEVIEPVAAGSVGSETPDPATPLDAEATKRKLARDLAWEGVDLFEGGQPAEASVRFERAYRLQAAPTVGLWSARALRDSGKLVEASERYVGVLRSQPHSDDPPVYAAARRDASIEYEALQPRVPSISFGVAGAGVSEVQVQLDGSRVPSELLGIKLPSNPGRHQVVADALGQTRVLELDLQEGEARLVELTFEAIVPVPPPAALVPQPPSPVAKDPRVPISASVWISYSVAAVGAGVGVGLGLSAQDKREDLEEVCADNNCDARYDEQRELFNQHRIGSLLGYGVGAAAAIVGTIVWLEQDSQQRSEVTLSPSYVSWKETF